MVVYKHKHHSYPFVRGYTMIIFNLVLLVESIFLLMSAVKAIKKKRYLDLVAVLLLFPFLLFCFFSANLGGSSFHDAQTDFEYYQAGHYYLESHGKYTEVSHFQYQFVRTLEIAGISALIPAFLWFFLRNFIVTDEGS